MDHSNIRTHIHIPPGVYGAASPGVLNSGYVVLHRAGQAGIQISISIVNSGVARESAVGNYKIAARIDHECAAVAILGRIVDVVAVINIDIGEAPEVLCAAARGGAVPDVAAAIEQGNCAALIVLCAAVRGGRGIIAQGAVLLPDMQLTS